MNKKTRKLLKENNSYEKTNLSEQCKQVMTDIVCYLRGSKLSEYNQEIVRRDINYMLVEGEGRGETPASIIGIEYKLFCDEIIKTFPERNFLDRLKSEINGITWAISIIALYWLIGEVGQALYQQTSVYYLNMTLGEIIGGVIFVIEADSFVSYITRTVFRECKSKENKSKHYLMLWILLIVLISVPLLFYAFLKSPSFTIILPVAIGIVLLPLLFGFLLDQLE